MCRQSKELLTPTHPRGRSSSPPRTPRRTVRVLDNVIELRLVDRSDGAANRPRSGEIDGSEGTCDFGALIRIDFEQCFDWVNGSVRGVWVRPSERGFYRVEVEQPVVSGVFRQTDWGIAGSFRVGGDGVSALDGLASFGLALSCAERGDLLLHASSVECRNRVLLFLGRGGSGKTTIAVELNGGRTPCSVDKVLVSSRPDGVLRAHSTPFGQGLEAAWRPMSGAIGGLFFLEQAEEHEVVALSRWEATTRLLAQTVAPLRDPASMQRAIDAVGRLADLDRSFVLRFRRDAGFWPLVEDALAKG